MGEVDQFCQFSKRDPGPDARIVEKRPDFTPWRDPVGKKGGKSSPTDRSVVPVDDSCGIAVAAENKLHGLFREVLVERDGTVEITEERFSHA